MVEFEQTARKTEVTVHYRVTGAPAIEHSVKRGRFVAPQVVRFTFRDGDVTEIFVNGKVVKANGEVGDKWEQIKHLFIWNNTEWPVWLHDLYATALEDYRTQNRAERDEIVSQAGRSWLVSL